MKIDMQSQLPVYRKKTGADSAVPSTRAGADGRRDVVDISHGTVGTDKEMRLLKASVQSSVNAPASDERLAELQTQIKNAEYSVSTNDLVSAMLGLR